MLYKNKEFATKKELFDFLITNKTDILAQKKSVIKTSDNFNFVQKNNETVVKAEKKGEVLTIIVAVNTTNWLDSHDDVHIDGLWNKTLKENRNIFFLQEHKNEFEYVIASGSDVKVTAKVMSWLELGYAYTGTTEVLIFTVVLREKRNELMFKQYQNSWVTNHSVGMQYVKLALAINDPYYKEEYANWQLYYTNIANKTEADKNGYFFAVLEAKLYEGSAVLIGSNTATPVLSIEPSNDTQLKIEPPTGTQNNILKNYYKHLKK